MKAQPQSRPGAETLERDRLRCDAASTRLAPSRAEAQRAEAENRVAAALRENLRKRKAQQEAKAVKKDEEGTK